MSLKNEAAWMLFDKDALHIYAALLIQLSAAKLSRRSLGHMLPWLAVFGLELANELIDVLRGREPVLRPWQVVAGLHDIINTMILPTVILALCRSDPGLFQWRRDIPADGCTGRLAERTQSDAEQIGA